MTDRKVYNAVILKKMMITIKPVTGKELKTLFNRPQFRRIMFQAAEETRKQGYEVGFNVARGVDGKIFIGKRQYGNDFAQKPREGVSSYFADEDLHRRMDSAGYDYIESHASPFITFHMHQPTGEIVSRGDLESMVRLRNCTETTKYGLQYTNQPLSLVGMWQPSNRLEVLVLQQKQERPMTETGAEILAGVLEEAFRQEYACVENGKENSITAAFFNARHELRAALLYYTVNRDNKQLLIDEDELKKLEQFAYAPRLISDKSGKPLDKKKRR